MTAPLPRGVASVASAYLQAFAAGLAIDERSRRAGYLAAPGSACPAGLDVFSFHIGQAERRRYGAGLP